MTIRLVALMSVVLLLSLAAFALSINHYQDQVMEEVRQTVSEVSRATVRTLEGRGHDLLIAPVDDPGTPTAVWNEAGTMTWTEEHADAPAGKRIEQIVVQGQASVGEPVPSPDGKMDIRRLEPGHGGDFEYEVRQYQAGSDDLAAFGFRCEDDPQTGEQNCETLDGELLDSGANQFFIRVDQIHAEEDAADGLVLRIPRFTHATHDEDQTVTHGSQIFTREELTTSTDGQPVMTRLEEIRLPIPVAEYDDLFQSVRRRSMWLFLGVFAVGTLLSAGLASRFTRPIRKLDGAIRQLSDGDLEAEVATRGTDEIARLGSAFNDMTRSLRSHQQRAREMTQREKQSALGRLAAGVAHDIRNPLHSIGLTLQHLQETCRPEGAEREAEFDRSLEIIRGEIRRLDRLVGNFLGFARSEPAERRPVDLRALIEETANLVRKEAEWRTVQLRLELAETVPAVHGDPEALRSSLLNLVLNSFEAMPDGGELTLSVGSSEGSTRVEVRDTGHGIDEEGLRKAFDFAYTTRDGGNGLGLAMVHHCVVEEHGGRVALESRPGQGTRLILDFPQATAARTAEGDGESA